MKTRIIFCTIGLLLSAFTGSVFGGTEAEYATFYGMGAGANNTVRYNTFIGSYCGYTNTTGNNNTFIGYDTGYYNTTGDYNTFLGDYAGLHNTGGEQNTFLGSSSGQNNTTGSYNASLGRSAGYSNTTGHNNTFLGYSAGYSNTTGYTNTFLGSTAGASNTTGMHNTFLGYSAGYSNTTGTGNVFFGYQAGFNETGSNKLYIDNSSTSTPLIYGEFDNRILTIYGSFGVGTDPLYTSDISAGGVSTSQLHFSLSGTDTGGWLTSVLDNNFFVSSGAAYINGQWVQKSSDGNAVMAGSGGVGYRVFTASGTTVGDAIAPENLAARLHLDYSGHVGINTPADPTVAIDTGTGAYLSLGGVWTSMSSREAKEDIKDLSTGEALEALSGLNPVKFAYKADPEERHVGFIAEDVPELIATKDRKGLSPMDIVAVLTKVVKEKSQLIEKLGRALEAMEKRLSSLEKQ